MKVTLEFLRSKNACQDGYDWFEQQGMDGKEITEIIPHFINNGKLDWANWLIVRCMNYKQCVDYAVFAAEQVFGIFENKYPEDMRPRMAIEAAKKCLVRASKNNKESAYAAYSAEGAAYAAYTAYAASEAYAAADAADADYAAYAAHAARYAAYVAEAARYAAYAAYAAAVAHAAADAARYAAYAAEGASDAAEGAADAAYMANAADAGYSDKMMIKILQHGIKILGGET